MRDTAEFVENRHQALKIPNEVNKGRSVTTMLSAYVGIILNYLASNWSKGFN